MPVISIRERGITSSGPVVAIEDQEYPIPNITAPFDEQQEALLEWYFEEHLRFPFTNQVKAATAAASIATYGQTLFAQIFHEPDAYSAISAFHEAIGQYIDYREGLLHKDPDRSLYLAVPLVTYETFFRKPFGEYMTQRYELKLIVYSPESKVIVQWLP